MLAAVAAAFFGIILVAGVAWLVVSYFGSNWDDRPPD